MERLIFTGICGVIAVILFRLNNPQKDYLNQISFFVLGIFISPGLMYVNKFLGISFWALSSIGLLTFYFLRFKIKQSKGLIDYLKWAGILLLIYMPFTSLYSTDNFWLTTSGSIVFYVLAIIYIYDRYILKPEKMKQKFIIVLVIQTFLIIGMLVFAVAQMTIAKQQVKLAETMRIECQQLKKAAEEEKIKASEMKKKYEELLKLLEQK